MMMVMIFHRCHDDAGDNTIDIKLEYDQENPAALELRENCFNRTDDCCKDATFSPEASFLFILQLRQEL